MRLQSGYQLVMEDLLVCIVRELELQSINPKAEETSFPAQIPRSEMSDYEVSIALRENTVCTAAATVLKCKLTDFETVADDMASLNFLCCW
jgi:hypothetical protein